MGPSLARWTETGFAVLCDGYSFLAKFTRFPLCGIRGMHCALSSAGKTVFKTRIATAFCPVAIYRHHLGLARFDWRKGGRFGRNTAVIIRRCNGEPRHNDNKTIRND